MNWLFIALPAGAETLLVYRLVSTGLARKYPALTIWMAFLAISMVLLLPFRETQSTGYRNAWIARQLVGMIVLFYALLELTNRILEHYPGLRRITASGLFGLVLAAAVIATANESLSKPVRFVWAMQGGWTIGTLVYVLALVGLATYLDPRRRRNVIIHERLFAASCAWMAATSFLITLRYANVDLTNWLGLIAGVGFPLLWLRMSPAGEVDRRPAVRLTDDPFSFAETELRLDRLEKMVTRSND